MAVRPEYCPNCFRPLGDQKNLCRWCGFTGFERENLLALPTNAVLKNRYIAGRILGAGGFGITYKGYDTETDQICAIKEYVPLENASRNKGEMSLNPTNSSRREIFEYGKKKFLDEADTLRKLKYISDVVDVWDCFSENGTAYFVMEYLDGSTLNAVRRQAGGRLPFEMAYHIFIRVCACLEEVHTKGNIFHRDISPENIMITRDKKVKLIDFGTAKYIHGKKSQNLSVVLKPGYAPPEQYASSGKQGAYTDVYAMASTFYYVLTGKKIPPAPDRLGFSGENSDFFPLEEYTFLGPAYKELTEIFNRALKPRADQRTQSMKIFMEELKNFHDHWEKEDRSASDRSRVPEDGDQLEVTEPVDKSEHEGIHNGNPGPVSSEKQTNTQKPFLLGLTEPIKGYRYYLPVNTMISLGRSRDSNIIIPLNVVGRKHLELFYSTIDRVFYLEDNFSVNQTILNGIICDPGEIYMAEPGSFLSLARDSCIFQLGVYEDRK